MRQLRKCTSSELNSGAPKCLPDMNKIKGAIVCRKGTKLPSPLTPDELEKLAHADGGERIYGIFNFVEFAKEGGEVQTSTTGYGPEEVTGFSARKDTFTMQKYNPVLHASITQCANQPYDVYYFDDEYKLFGQNDGTDVMAGIPMSGIYSNLTPYNTSSNKPEMTITFCYEDAKQADIDWDMVKLNFNPGKLILGLVPVKLEKSDNGYKIFEDKGGYDLTSELGPVIAEVGQAVIKGTSSAVSYDADKDVLTITGSGEIGLKAPSVLYESGIKGVVAV